MDSRSPPSKPYMALIRSTTEENCSESIGLFFPGLFHVVLQQVALFLPHLFPKNIIGGLTTAQKQQPHHQYTDAPRY